MATTLNIHQVARMLGRSTKSIRNYIKDGRLTAEKISSPRGLEYRFDFTDLASFAKKHLNVSVEANIPSFAGSAKGPGRPSGSSTGAGELSRLLMQLEKEKTDLLKELGELKAQVGYKIGQLESQVKLLESAKTERDALQTKFISLEHEHSQAQEELAAFKDMQAYYASKRWWHFWKGKYVPARKTAAA